MRDAGRAQAACNAGGELATQPKGGANVRTGVAGDDSIPRSRFLSFALIAARTLVAGRSAIQLGVG
jgi:hypothetical protein